MSLREDNGPYCLVWLGMLLMGAYYTSFAYMIWTDSVAAAILFAPTNFLIMLGLMILPPLMAFFFTGYLRPARGKAKMTMLGPSVFLGLIYVVIVYTLSTSTGILSNLFEAAGWDINSTTTFGNLLVFSGWGIASAILTAGGFSIAQSYEQSTSPGMLDVSSLHYGPPKEEEEEPEPENATEAEPVASESETVEPAEAHEEPTKPEADSEDSKPVETDSE